MKLLGIIKNWRSFQSMYYFYMCAEMYKNQLQELAQRSCFNLPSYSCIREGPDHAPRFKATVNFNGDTFESPTFCSTLRQAEHAAAEVALNTLANRGPSRALAARVLVSIGANLYQFLCSEYMFFPHYIHNWYLDFQFISFRWIGIIHLNFWVRINFFHIRLPLISSLKKTKIYPQVCELHDGT